MKINDKEHSFFVPVVGLHHVYNAMAAIICGLHFGMNIEDIAMGVSAYKTSGMRQKEIKIGNIKLIEDCYNASSDSMRSSLNVLKSVSGEKRSIAVLGDMLEQGDFAEENHRLVGEYVASVGTDVLVCIGNDARFIADEARKNNAENIFEFSANEEASEFLCKYVTDGDTVLFKASRGMALEEVSSALQKFLKG